MKEEESTKSPEVIMITGKKPDQGRQEDLLRILTAIFPDEFKEE